MGESRDSHGIRNFWPDDTDTKIYIVADYDTIRLEDLLRPAYVKWPDANSCPERLFIGSEYIHTRCLGYDLYDPGDYTQFITIEYNEDA